MTWIVSCHTESFYTPLSIPCIPFCSLRAASLAIPMSFENTQGNATNHLRDLWKQFLYKNKIPNHSLCPSFIFLCLPYEQLPSPCLYPLKIPTETLQSVIERKHKHPWTSFAFLCVPQTLICFSWGAASRRGGEPGEQLAPRCQIIGNLDLPWSKKNQVVSESVLANRKVESCSAGVTGRGKQKTWCWGRGRGGLQGGRGGHGRINMYQEA